MRVEYNRWIAFRKRLSTEISSPVSRKSKEFWGAEGAMIELSKQSESRQHHIQEGHYFFSGAGEENRKKLANELADIFGQVIRIADFYHIDLLEAHMDARQEEANLLSQRGV